MCKNVRVQSRVIEQAKRDTPLVFGVFERDVVRDLVGIIKVFDRSTAVCESVHRYGDTEHWKSVPTWSNPTPRVMASWFGLNLSECEIVPC